MMVEEEEEAHIASVPSPVNEVGNRTSVHVVSHDELDAVINNDEHEPLVLNPVILTMVVGEKGEGDNNYCEMVTVLLIGAQLTYRSHRTVRCGRIPRPVLRLKLASPCPFATNSPLYPAFGQAGAAKRRSNSVRRVNGMPSAVGYTRWPRIAALQLSFTPQVVL